MKQEARSKKQGVETKIFALPQPALRGFTMIEILLSIACLTIIFAMSVPAYMMLQARNDLDIATITVAESYRRAQVESQSANGDSRWGVHIATGSILIYKGSSYGARDVAFDEDTMMPASIVVSGLNDVNFSKIYGLPNGTGTTTLTSVKNETRNITINQKGIVDY